GTAGAAGTVAGASGLSFDEVVSFRWEATLAGGMLSARGLVAPARLKAPLVRFRGQWVAVDPKELEEARRLLAAGGATLAAHEAVAVALGESARRPEARLPVDVVAEGQLAGVVARLRGGLGTDGVTVPRNFRGTLRPYQERGLAWLARMADLCLGAGFRVALTGTPVENRLAELWSISEYLNPRLLGTLESFRREIAVPVERYGRNDVAERLRRIVGPFILRRVKSDPGVIRDLPPKQEMKVVCTLTREQASLYQAAVEEAMRRIESADGIQRRGLVLALITALKQICNHPAHYLGEAGPLAGRSGKLARLGEMLEEVVAAGDRALVFTQFREMGNRLVAAL